MKKNINRLVIFCLITLTGLVSQAQKTYKYETVPGDLLNVRIYTLDNGLKVFLSVYKDAPRIQTAIAVKTGSKNDPSDNTGLSHYLEHMMFKGTSEFGTKDYAKEKPLLNQIEALFEVYRKTTDTTRRKQIYHQIDSISGLAAGYAIASEYDKLLSVIGAKGTNAFTSFEETVYINDIPSNKVSQWLEIEENRFQDPVFRLFHTELETVYEEKNISLDTDDDKVYDALFLGLFPTHTYGTQTTIGTVEHLKNPSLTSLKAYYAARYVPNNMAILMAGDFNPDVVIKDIDATFGKLPSKPVHDYVPPVEKPITAPVVLNVYGPDAESVTMGYRLGGAATPDADLLTLFSMILSNSTAGLIDLDLNQAQKVLEAGCSPYILKDYSVSFFYGKAKQGQSLDEVRDLMLQQINRVKKGDFPDWLLPAIINDLKLSEVRQSESNQGRVFSILDGFIKNIPRSTTVHDIDRLSKITKQQIMDFASKNFTDDYVIVYKHTGKDENVQKVIKPVITPVTMNRDDESAFLKKIMAEPSLPVEPVFIDYSKDLQKLSVKNIPVLYKENTETKTFSLYYYFEMGTNTQREYGIALDYLKYLGTGKYSPKEIQEEFYKLGCSFNVYTSEDEIWVMLSGLSENMEKGMQLFEHLLADAQPNPEALKNLVSDIKKRRDDDKLSKSTILWSAMYNYGVYGPKSPFTNILSSDELDGLSPETLTDLIHGLTGYQHDILYYGPDSPMNVLTLMERNHQAATANKEAAAAPPTTTSINAEQNETKTGLKPLPKATRFEQLPTDKTNVYSVDYDMKQVEIVMLSRSQPYNKEIVPVVRVFNEYFGGSSSSIVFQEIRESKGLAYSAYAGYRGPSQPWQKYYLFGYLGTQTDKLPEAMKAMTGIFNNMPESDKAFSAAKEAIINKIRTERITKAQVLFNYLNSEKFGLTYDIRKDVFSKVPAMKMADLKAFQEKFIKDKNFSILVLGKKDKLDFSVLEKYGPVKQLELKDVFGY